MKVPSEDKKSWAEGLLYQKYKELGRLPKKEDFDDVTRSRIKAYLGPWPRALEAAGLKEPKPKALKTKKRSCKNKRLRASSFKDMEKTRSENDEKIADRGIDKTRRE